jgi:hypothetical protein
VRLRSGRVCEYEDEETPKMPQNKARIQKMQDAFVLASIQRTRLL